MSWIRTGIGVFAACLLGAATVSAQTANVTGRVVDPADAAVVDARVTLTSPTAQRRETRTGGDGSFAFGPLTPGAYTLRVDASGFSIFSQTITATAGAPALTVGLKVAGLSEAISVVGTAPSTLETPALTGTRLGLTPLETPASVSILSGETIRERGDETVAEANERAMAETWFASMGVEAGVGHEARADRGADPERPAGDPGKHKTRGKEREGARCHESGDVELQVPRHRSRFPTDGERTLISGARRRVWDVRRGPRTLERLEGSPTC